jgi:hypothetical protein
MVEHPDFGGHADKVEGILSSGTKMAREGEPGERCYNRELLTTYGRIARRCRDDRVIGLSRYPYEEAPGDSPYIGG